MTSITVGNEVISFVTDNLVLGVPVAANSRSTYKNVGGKSITIHGGGKNIEDSQASITVADRDSVTLAYDGIAWWIV